MQGRKRTPTALKKLHGKPGHHRLNAAEPTPPGALDDPPEWLTPEQAASWRHALDCAPPGLLRRLDRGLLTIWVVAEDTHRRAAQMLQLASNLMMKMKGVPAPVPSNYLGIMNKQALIMLRTASELGFSPSARARAYAQPAGTLPAARLATGAGRKVIPLAEYVANAPPRPRR